MEKIRYFNFDGREIFCEVRETNTVSDGFHTFGELYDHRIALCIALCRIVHDVNKSFNTPPDVFRSKEHHPDDGKMYEGWFVLGLGLKPGKEQITYHLPLSRWEECSFAETLEHAPKWDGHTPQDVLERLNRL